MKALQGLHLKPNQKKFVGISAALAVCSLVAGAVFGLFGSYRDDPACEIQQLAGKGDCMVTTLDGKLVSEGEYTRVLTARKRRSESWLGLFNHH
jgi:hypothetical protein